MPNNYKKYEATLFDRKAILDMKKIKDELKEHRYFLERNVERRTEHLLRRIALLESCNTTLCNKLSLAYKEIIALKQQLLSRLKNNKAASDDGGGVKLYLANSQTLKQHEMSAQQKSGEHATAARARLPSYLNGSALNRKFTQPEEIDHVLMEMSGPDRQVDTPTRFE